MRLQIFAKGKVVIDEAVQFRHLRRRDERNKISDYGGHTVMGTISGRVMVTSCSAKDKFCKRSGRLNCLLVFIRMVLGKEWWITGVETEDNDIRVFVSDHLLADDSPLRDKWWLK